MPRARATRPERTQPPAQYDPGPDPLACEVDGLHYRLDALPGRHGKRSVLSVAWPTATAARRWSIAPTCTRSARDARALSSWPTP